ncbi:MAG: hypothetical protein K2Q22_02595, partial [Cytophagales bacterium]|nr:hypothetical protein [Cytophagales bacterium]
MGLFDFISGGAKKSAKNHLRNLVQVALADGQIDQIEYNFLLSVAKKLNVSVSELEKLKSSPLKPDHLYKTVLERYEQLYDFIDMMYANKDIDKEEMRLCKLFANKLFDKKIADELVASTSSNIENGNNSKETYNRVKFL